MDRLPLGGSKAPSVVVDNVEAAMSATNHLIGLGHRNIAIVTGRLNLSIGAERLTGFRAAMREAGLPIRDGFIQEGDFHPESGHSCTLALMRMPDRPTAIFSCNNSMTLGLMHALADLDVHCPDQVSVVAFDDLPWTQYFHPQLTVVAQPVHELGAQAMRVLLAAMEPNSAEAREIKSSQIVLKAELRVRQSTAPPRANLPESFSRPAHRLGSGAG